MSNKENIPEGVLAAISMAIYEMADQVHDVESNVITIKRIPQSYYPWSAKEHGMMKMPRK